MTIPTNQSLSVDCVIFGFDGSALKVLLVERPQYEELEDQMKLPGAMILENETLPNAAVRVLENLTGVKAPFLQQLEIFSDPNRLTEKELQWASEKYKVNTTRVVTVGYYALVKLNKELLGITTSKKAQWIAVEDIHRLAMDHKQILSIALERLYKDAQFSPIMFELLPRKFTISELQRLFEVILGIELDNRNFRKKIFQTGFLIPTGEKEKGVAHKPAEYFIFDKNAYNKAMKPKAKIVFINNWR